MRLKPEHMTEGDAMVIHYGIQNAMSTGQMIIDKEAHDDGIHYHIKWRLLGVVYRLFTVVKGD